jgi:hypothetical protein
MASTEQEQPADELTCHGCDRAITADQRCWVQAIIYRVGDNDIGVRPVFWHEWCTAFRAEITGVVA